jgi:hypothetical protein
VAEDFERERPIHRVAHVMARNATTSTRGAALTLGSACVDLGRIVLPDAGTYAIEVYADGTAAGAYAFQFRSSL